MISNIVKNELKRIAGERSVSFSKEELLCYSYDATNTLHLPEAVVFPTGPEEISLILKMANSEGFPVIPRGAGTGFSGGSLPVEGGVVISFERMKRIIEVDTENLIAVAEPGVVTWDLQQEVERHGLFYPPDPSSLKVSTIGGNIAECAGGPRAVKYGVTRDYILGLEVVLPTGEIVNTGVRTAKGVVGYDLTRLMVGSEGTLGIVTKAILRLLPLPEATKTMLALFGDMKKAAAATSAIIRGKVIPSTLEIMDRVSLRCVEEYSKAGLPDVEALLLIEVDGPKGSVEKEAEAVRAICLEYGATDFRAAADKHEVKELWKARRAISASLYRVKPNKINEDIVVPRSRIPELVEGLKGISKDRGVLIASFGHAGDGNIHVNVMYDKKDPVEAASALDAVTDVFRLTVGLGGTISGEHGVGTAKSRYIGMELTPVAIDAMKKIKAALDPRGILNPGKIFPKAVEAEPETSKAGFLR
ncbi:MAG TPA: glycolate oxidase subunit GlcD [Deltaproteobacteria bacterium]|nr:MAG: glycolate oxidase subunit GlcD [Deltaproteobacteria bacterium GWA2_55_82]OGQ62355.1 MAG: glycolate oxidase subunit GlcD [Deltaproteobacteria bacterium RIFCSPLOWO2_02_FULL_55_12]OIJ73265.1 MAG: glycolate oxidase subunit GlcD [Deltaproteobacteria bacterium GWC2_55_46]HBG45471.1 glycolate oxidase subunit GlcD [Deltaproteobacteria bacterium]HCY10302.1 glycolate oxidase subunit GlcD [Deltaproteobacteria bacterium]